MMVLKEANIRKGMDNYKIILDDVTNILLEKGFSEEDILMFVLSGIHMGIKSKDRKDYVDSIIKTFTWFKSYNIKNNIDIDELNKK